MAAELFLSVIRMTLTGSVAILAVMAARLLLKKAPKVFSCCLWGVVLFRLLCPVAPTAAIGLPQQLKSGAETADAGQIGESPQQVFSPAENTPADAAAGQTAWLQAGTAVWLAGFGVMTAVNGLRYFRLRRKLRTATRFRENIYVSDRVEMPFAMGIVRPRIYLPAGLREKEERFILAHEQFHIRRGDPVVKLLFFAAVCVHWFNPLVWAAFYLCGKDMEMSCDEAVVRKLGPDIRAEYAGALLRFAAGRPAGAPLAFGEGDVRQRILNLAAWRKPRKWACIAAGLLCGLVLTVCVFNYAGKPEPQRGIYRMEQPGEQWPAPALLLYPEEGRFSFTFDYLSSYYIAGSYRQEGDTLIATTDSGMSSYAFEILDGETLRYLGGSLMTVRGGSAVLYGAVFRLTEPVAVFCSDLSCTDPAHNHTLFCGIEGCTDPAHGHTAEGDCGSVSCTEPDHVHPGEGHYSGIQGSDCISPMDHNDDRLA